RPLTGVRPLAPGQSRVAVCRLSTTVTPVTRLAPAAIGGHATTTLTSVTAPNTDRPRAEQPASPTPSTPTPPADATAAAADAATTAAPTSSTAAKLADLAERVATGLTAPAQAAIDKQHGRGKKSARERIEALLDPDSFVELDAFATHHSTNFGLDKRRIPGDGVVVGYGTVDGRQVCVYSQDFTVFGGSLGETHGRKITKVQDMALRTGVPLIGISDGGGARIQEGVAALTQFAEIFRRNVAASGVVPQISLILGPSAGGAVYSPALTDFIIMAEGTSNMFITGPDVIRAVTGEDVGFEELGGAATHNERSGVAHYLATDEEDAIEYARALLAFLPPNNLTEPPTWPADTGELEVSA